MEVKLSIYINDLGLCSKHQELTIGGYFRQRWNDPRLAIDLGGDGGVTTIKKSVNIIIFLKPNKLIRVHFFRRSSNAFDSPKIWIPDTFSPADRLGFSRDKIGHSFFRVKCCGGVLLSVKSVFKHSVLDCY